MSNPSGQVDTPQAAVSDICPQCGAILTGRSVSLQVKVSGPADTELLYHPSWPDFPAPPGCRRVWVPFHGYLDVDDDIRKRVDRFFSVPMLALALLVLPLLVIDYYVTRGVEKHTWITRGVMYAHITVSVAFLVEFFVKIKIAQSRLGYLARNWIDLIIIILPFLRSIRILQSLRLLRSLEAARVMEFSRVYAVRGVGLKAVRTMVPVLLGLRFTQRFRRSSVEAAAAGRPNYSKWPRAALVLEVERLNKRVDELERAAAPAEGVSVGQGQAPAEGAKV